MQRRPYFPNLAFPAGKVGWTCQTSLVPWRFAQSQRDYDLKPRVASESELPWEAVHKRSSTATRLRLTIVRQSAATRSAWSAFRTVSFGNPALFYDVHTGVDTL